MTKRASASDVRAIGRYVERVLNRADEPRAAYLGRLPGFPNQTRDPDVIERAAAVYRDRASDPDGGMMKRLAAIQRAQDLDAIAYDLRDAANGDDPDRAAFVKYAAAWSVEHGITRSAWRELGLPAALCDEAGIT